MPLPRRVAGLVVALLAVVASRGWGAGQGWRSEEPLGEPPGARLFASAVYDPNRDRMVLWGGYAYGPALQDSWLLLLNGRPKWSRLDPSGEPPPGSWDHTAIYDPARDRVLVYGGLGTPDGAGAEDGGAVWSLDLARTAWGTPAIAGDPPPPRDSHTAIYDPTGDRMIVFGGGGESGLLDDVWELSLAGTPRWAPILAGGTPPPARARHSAIYDPDADCMIVFGGATYFGEMLNDVWSLSLGANPTWTRLTPAGPPPSPRAGHRAVYDPVRHSMRVLGGYQGGAAPFASDQWELSLAGPLEWRQVGVTGASPGGRFSPQVVLDGRKKRVVLCGGSAGGADLDVWSFGATSGGDDEPRSFTIGPNPMKATQHALTFFVTEPGRLDIEVVDVTGRRVWKGEVGPLDTGWHSTTLGASLAPGLYWVRALQNGKSSAARLAVVR